MTDLSNIIITEIMEVISVPSPKGRFLKIHNRECYGLSFCLEGQITYTHNGKNYVSDPSHAIILPKGENYSLCGDKKGSFAVINFECINFECDEIILIPTSNIHSLMKNFEQLKSLFLFKKNKPKTMSILYDIIHTLSYADTPELNLLLPAVNYIEVNYSSSELTNNELASLCKISEVYFRKLFLKSYGVTPKQFIIDIRLTHAKQLLADGVLRINEISDKCGFTNPYHFCRLFKQKTGITPTQYMKQNRIFKI